MFTHFQHGGRVPEVE